MENRLCAECREIIRGRTDKKFCGDLCRNAFNNKQNSDCNNYVRNINNALRRNRRLLEEHLLGETTTLPKIRLLQRGLDFSIYTNHFVTHHNRSFFFCYEYGYCLLENELVMIVKNDRASVLKI